MTAGVETGHRLPRLEVAFDASSQVREVLADLGRTEDIRLSPSGRRAAIACYAPAAIAVADLDLERTSDGVNVSVTALERHMLSMLGDPHGVDFIDEETVVVGSRSDQITLFRLPPAGSGDEITLLASLDGELDSPGSVAVRSLPGGGHEVFAVHNWANAVGRYELDPSGTLVGHQTVARRWLDLPDGVAISRDGRWLAVSNHDSHDVFVYARATMAERDDPVAVLRGVGYPHGLSFGSADRHLFVADAGAPYVHVFSRAGDAWGGASYPMTSIRVMDEDTFLEGHRTPQEGGPKGIDLDPHTGVLVITAETAPLAFFDADGALEHNELRPGDELVRYELRRLEEIAQLEEETAAAVDQLRELRQTKAWRLTEPLRRAHGALRGPRPRRH